MLTKRTKWFRGIEHVCSIATFCFLILLITFVPFSAAQAVQFCSNNGGTGWTINDNALTTATVDVQMGDAVGAILDVNARTEITHTWVGDLDATLTSPGGTSTLLFDRPGSVGAGTGCAEDNLLVTFDDEAGTGNIENICNPSPLAIGDSTYEPHVANTLANLDASTANGTWSFDINDNAAQDIGNVDNICVDIQAAAITFDRWVSVTADCADQVSTLSVPQNTNVYLCYTVTNSGSETFSITAGNITDNLGNDLSPLQGVYAAGTSNSLVFSYVSGGTELPLGTSTYTAQVTATGAAVGLPLNVNKDATVTVSATPVATAGNKPLYLVADTGLSRTAPATTGVAANLNGGGSNTWTLTPVLAGDLSFNTTDIPITLRLSESGFGSNRSFTLTLASDTGGTIGTLAVNQAIAGGTNEYTYAIPVSNNATIIAGSVITLTITNNSANGRRIQIEDTNGAGSVSQLSLDATSVINVDDVSIYDAAYSGGALIPGAVPGATIYVRATVSDPFGDYDVSSATFDIIDDTGTVVSTVTQTVPIVEVVDDPAIALFEYAYTVPAGASGTWTARVTATEGAEGTVSHSWSTPLTFGYPNLMILKSATTPRTVNTLVNSGEDITYTVTITNNGPGVAANVAISDAISALLSLCTNCQGGQAFTFSDGVPASGLSLGVPTYTDRLGAPYVPAAGYDANIGAFNVPMSGYMLPNTSFSLIYQARTK